MSDPRRPAPSAVGTGSAAAAAVERWAMPEMQGPVVGRVGVDRRQADLDAVRAARLEAEIRGFEAGQAKAQAENQARLTALDAKVQQLDAILQFLSRPLQELDGQVENELTQLALVVGKQLARRELAVDPAQVIAIIRESLGQLPASARDVRVHLHPEDAVVVREKLAAPTSERAWTVVEDPTLSRGGCVVRTDNSQIDARLESRVHALVTSTFGAERN
ncbi:MAG TPA: flagellar assembly protein FliH [Steroidobacteraceae bacterium]